MFSNLYKAGWFVVDEDTRVIDTNKLAEMYLKKAGGRPAQLQGQQGKNEEGFVSGLEAQAVDALLAEEGNQGPSREEREALEKELESARNELESVRAQTEQMMQNASVQIEEMRQGALEEARSQGYQDGYEQGMAEVRELKEEYLAKQRELKEEYWQKVEELEPEFIKNLTEIYEHIFKVDLSAYSQIVVNLLTDTMQKTDSAKSYIVHVSRQDYPQVYGERQKILEETGTLSDRLEIISDMTLSVSQCMIETEDGIYDCSLGTELEELKRKLKLLSYKSM